MQINKPYILIQLLLLFLSSLVIAQDLPKKEKLPFKPATQESDTLRVSLRDSLKGSAFKRKDTVKNDTISLDSIAPKEPTLLDQIKYNAKEYVKRVEDLTYGYATIIGEVIPRGVTPIMIY